MRNLILSKKPSLFAFLAGILYSLSFPPYDLPFLIVPAFIATFAAWERAPSNRIRAREGVWITQVITWLSFTWVAYSIRQFGGLPTPLAYLCLFIFGFICQPQFWLFAWVWKKLTPPKTARWGLSRVLLVALAYTALDTLLPKLFVDTAGHAYYSSRWLRQAADIGGAPLLTFFTVTLSLVGWRWIELLAVRVGQGKQGKRLFSVADLPQELMRVTSFSLILWLSWVGYGAWREEDIRNLLTHNKNTVQMAVIQANIGDFDKVAAEQGYTGAAQAVLSQYFQLSDQALSLTPRPQVLVWPETAYPSTFNSPRSAGEARRDQSMRDFATSRKTPLFFGGYDHEGSKDFNAFFMISPSAPPPNDLQSYRKNILLWFGEYMPLSEHIEWLRTQFPQVGNFGRGPGPSVYPIPGGGTLSPVICYEVLFASYVLDAARQGSQLIMNVTNDSWFGPWGEPHLHFALSIFRGIEARIPQLRATNTGISALVMPDGSVVRQTPLFVPEIMNVSVPLFSQPIWTLMRSWGDWFRWFALVAAVAFYFFSQRLERKRARR